MVRVNYFMYGFLNACLLMGGFTAMASAHHLRGHGISGCHKWILSPLLVTGYFQFSVALIGLICSFWKNKVALAMNLLVTFLFILCLVVSVSVTVVITDSGKGHDVPGMEFKEYEIGDYSSWWQERFANGEKRHKIGSCLADQAQVCKNLRMVTNTNATEFYQMILLPEQSGCCKPPVSCGFEYENGTFWRVPKSGGAAVSNNSDCTTWRSDVKTLCYNCNSCKAALLANAMDGWRTLATINVLTLVFTTIILFVGCILFNNHTISHYEQTGLIHHM